MMAEAPVIAVDGPSGAGKGTLCRLLAAGLGWHYLDSGALYRLLALKALRSGVDPDDADALGALAAELAIEFVVGADADDPAILLDGVDVSRAIRDEAVSLAASRVAALPVVRTSLQDRQRAFRRAPGLVADGRDMGTVVFPAAELKVFLTASAQERAERRYKQLIDKGLDANLAALLESIRARDERDSRRSVAPLVAAEDAMVVDSTELDIDQVFDVVMQEARRRELVD